MALPKEVVLSVSEWYNLLAALKTVIERYGLEEVEQAALLMAAGCTERDKHERDFVAR